MGRRIGMILSLLLLAMSPAIVKADHLPQAYIVAYSFGGTTQYQFYEDDTYRNHCLAFTTYANSREKINGPLDSHFINLSGFNYGMTFLPDLKNIHVIGTNSSSWNDRITSIIITRM